MSRLSQMPAPGLPLTGMELVPALQGGDTDGNVGLPLLALGQLPSGNVLKLRSPMVADLSAATDADPGAGKIRWNNADPAAATVLFVDDVDGDAGDLTTALAALTVGGFVYVQACSSSARRDVWQKWQVTSVTDAAGYTKVGVSLQGDAGTFVGDEELELTLQGPTPSPGVDRNVVSVLAISSGNVTVDCSLGDYFTLALNANVTGWTFTNVAPGCSLLIEFTQDSTSRTVAWPTSFVWPGGVAGAVSTGSGAQDMLAISTFDAGGSWKATIGKAFA